MYVDDRGSSDESSHACDAAAAHFSNNSLHHAPGQSSRPAWQSSRPSSRQGQKYTTTTTSTAAAAAAVPVVTGYRDNMLPNRKVRLTLQY